MILKLHICYCQYVGETEHLLLSVRGRNCTTVTVSTWAKLHNSISGCMDIVHNLIVMFGGGGISVRLGSMILIEILTRNISFKFGGTRSMILIEILTRDISFKFGGTRSMILIEILFRDISFRFGGTKSMILIEILTRDISFKFGGTRSMILIEILTRYISFRFGGY